MAGWAETSARLSVLFLVMPSLYLCLSDQCDLELIRIPGDIVLSTIVGLREPRNGLCGDFVPSELQAAAGMVWAVEKLNGSNIGESYIPGRTIGIDIADDCSLERKAVKIALDTLTRVGSPDISTCSRIEHSNETSTVIGIIDTSTSQTVQRVAEIVRDSNLPVIASAATSAALGNATTYPSFFRTVPSDVEQTKVLLQTVKQLNWSYIAVVYTSDAYGKEGVRLFRQLVQKEEKLCIMSEVAMSPHEMKGEVAKEILASLISKLTKTRHDHLGIVFIGQLPQATILIRTQQEGRKIYKDFERLFWVMSEAVGTNKELIPKTSNQLGGLITVALPSAKIAEFKTYFIRHLERVIEGTSNHPLTRLFKKYIEISYNCNVDSGSRCSWIDRSFLEKNYRQSDYVATAIDAVYVLVTALKTARPSSCPGDPLCVPPSYELRNFVNQVRKITLDYSMIHDRFAPYEYSLFKRKIKFDQSGDVISYDRPVSYEIYNVWEGTHNIVGSYKNNTLDLTTENIRARDPVSGLPLSGSNLPRSVCKASCPECILMKDIQFSYIPGELLIVGLFSLSSKIDGDFQCGDFRSNTVSYLTLEAFQNAINVVQKEYPQLRFGGIAFDDCYNPLRAEYILSNFLSGNYKLIDHSTNTPIDPKKVVLLVGPLSSDVTLEVADMLTRLRIPQISYGATSPDLNNREKYPYFLRTVPSDETQANAIVDILVDMKWDYVAGMYFNNNYGTKGMETFKKKATEKGICLAKAVIPISEEIIKHSMRDIVSRLRRSYVKVIVYFGSDTLAEKLLNGLKEHAGKGEFLFVAAEAWGVSKQLLQEGRENYAKGSIVLHSDTASQGQYQEFDHFLAKKNPYTCTRCEWFRLFWQDRFKCNFEDGFTGPNNEFPLCNLEQHGKLTESDIIKYSRDQRVVQTINAVYAGAKGIKTMLDKVCSGKICTPSFILNRDPEVAQNLTRNISRVILPPSINLFDHHGNGKTGYSLFNIQYSPVAGGYVYEEVGKYEDNTLHLRKEDLIFYDKYGREQNYDFIRAKCELDTCKECEKHVLSQDKKNTTIAENQSDDGLSGAVIGVSVIAFLAIGAFIVVIVICACRRKTPKHAEENYYQEVGDHVNPVFSISEPSQLANPNLSIQNMSLHHEVNSTRGIRAYSGSSGGNGSGSSGNSRPSDINQANSSASSETLRHPCTCPNSAFIPMRTGKGSILVCTSCAGIFNATTLCATTV